MYLLMHIFVIPKDMLMAGKTLPGVYGASSPRMNVADLRTKGWEASVTWGDSFTLASKPFNYRIMAGIGDNTSKVTKYDNPNRTTESLRRTAVGRNMGIRSRRLF